jgi:hypothetical protein
MSMGGRLSSMGIGGGGDGAIQGPAGGASQLGAADFNQTVEVLGASNLSRVLLFGLGTFISAAQKFGFQFLTTCSPAQAFQPPSIGQFLQTGSAWGKGK